MQGEDKVLKYNVSEPSEVCMSVEQLQRFFDFIMGDDLDFYDEYTINLTGEEQERIYREIMRKISELEDGRQGRGRFGLLK